MKKLKLRRLASQMPSELVAQPSANDIDAELGIERPKYTEVVGFRAESIMQIFGAQQEIWQKFVFRAAAGRPTDMALRVGSARRRRRAGDGHGFRDGYLIMRPPKARRPVEQQVRRRKHTGARPERA